MGLIRLSTIFLMTLVQKEEIRETSQGSDGTFEGQVGGY